jgi:hypothetical protein
VQTIAEVGPTVTLGNYDETFFVQEALIQLEKVLGMAGRVHRDATAEAQVKGATVSMRRPASFTATDMPVSDSDVPTESVSLTFNKWKGVTFALTDKDLTLSAPQIIENHIRPAPSRSQTRSIRISPRSTSTSRGFPPRPPRRPWPTSLPFARSCATTRCRWVTTPSCTT